MAEDTNCDIRESRLSWVLSVLCMAAMGVSLLFGYSALQIYDFLRRVLEVSASVMPRRRRLWGTVFIVFGCSLVLMIFSFDIGINGNPLPALVVAAVSLTVRCILWIKNLWQDRVEGPLNSRNRCLLDGCVTAVLLTAVVAPEVSVYGLMNFTGAMAVAMYLLMQGMEFLRDTQPQQEENWPAADVMVGTVRSAEQLRYNLSTHSYYAPAKFVSETGSR